MTITIWEFEAEVKPADRRHTAGKLYFPKAWIGKKVAVYLVNGNVSKQSKAKQSKQASKKEH